MLPMIPGTMLGPGEPADVKHTLVAYGVNQYSLLIKPRPDAEYRIPLKRNQKFAPEERKLVGFFIEGVADVLSQAKEDYVDDLMKLLPRRVVGRLLGNGTQGRHTLEDAIQWLESLAPQTYEGNQIVAAIGITASVNHGSLKIKDLEKGDDFEKVLSNGFDTMFVCGKDGRVFNIECLKAGRHVSVAPFRFNAVANWCNREESRRGAESKRRDIDFCQ